MKKLALSALVIAASGAYVWSQAGTTSDPLLANADLQTGSISTLTSAEGATNVAPREAPFVTTTTKAPAAPAEAPAFAAQAPADQVSPPLPAPAASAPSGFAPAPADNAPTSPTAPVAVADAQSPMAPAPDPAPGQPAAITVPLPRLRPPYHQVAAVAPTPAPASAPTSSSASAAVSPMVRIAAATTGLADGTYRGPVVNAYYGLMQIEAVIRNGHLERIHVLRYPNTHGTSIYINRRALPQLRDEVISAQSSRVDVVSGATLSSHAFIQSLGGALRKARV